MATRLALLLVLFAPGAVAEELFTDDALLLLQTNAVVEKSHRGSDPEEEDTDAVPHTELGRRSNTSLKYLMDELYAIAAQNKRNGVQPPLIMASEGCSGSSTVLHHAKVIMQGNEVPVFEARKELFKSSKNPYSKGATSEAEALVAVARAASDKKQMLLFKVQADWIDFHDDVRKAMVALSPRTVTTLRENVLDQVVCKVRDCFDTSTGQCVDEDGERSKLCFKRRQSKETILAKMDIEKMNRNLREKLADREVIPGEMDKDGFGKSMLFYYEKLMAFEMDSSQMASSAKEWQVFMKDLGFDFTTDAITKSLEYGSGTYPAPGPHSETIFNFEEVEKELKKDSQLSGFFRSQKDTKPSSSSSSSEVAKETEETVYERAEEDETETQEDDSEDVAEDDADNDDASSDDTDDADAFAGGQWKPPSQRTPEEARKWHEKFS